MWTHNNYLDVPILVIGRVNSHFQAKNIQISLQLLISKQF